MSNSVYAEESQKLEINATVLTPANIGKSEQEAAQNAADELDPEEALEDDTILFAFRTATEAVEKACTVADELVSLAEAAGHEIRR